MFFIYNKLVEGWNLFRLGGFLVPYVPGVRGGSPPPLYYFLYKSISNQSHIIYPIFFNL